MPAGEPPFMIEVVLTMHGNLRRLLPEGRASLRLSVPDGSTVRDLLELVDAADDVWLAAIDGKPVPFSRALAPLEEVHCHEPIEGG